MEVWYKCSKCGKDNIKLWRTYQSFACMGVLDKLDNNGMLERGWAPGKTDQVNSKVPASPIVGADVPACWGYCSVPDEAVAAWKALPNK